MLDGIDLSSLGLDPLLLALPLLGVQGILLLLEGLVSLGVGLAALLVQDLVNDGHVALDGGELVGIGLLLLLIELLGLLLLIVGFLLDDALLTLLAFLGNVHDVDGAVEEGNTGGDGVETDAGLTSESPPIEVRVGAGFGRQLSSELLDETGRVVAGNLHELVDLPGSPLTHKLEVVTVHHSLAGVPDALEELVVLPADLLEGIGIGILELGAGLARHDLVLELALLPPEGPPLLVGLARLLHHLDLFLLLLAPAAAPPAVALLRRGHRGISAMLLGAFVGTLLALSLPTPGVVGRPLVALVLVVRIGHD
mmetsp:Transcript_2767/g.8136  ORF Transcript_2767/g.8136 Transcript_2767/m.8136 type:complete len:310 (-) Transcript_2767:114-1043(-)